jgi:transcriptional regulator with XRE-family HTH domain
MISEANVATAGIIREWHELGLRLRKRREHLEIKCEDAAEAVHLSVSELSLIENGRRCVDALELKRFAEAYRQSIELLTGVFDAPLLPENVLGVIEENTGLSTVDRSDILRLAKLMQYRLPDREDWSGCAKRVDARSAAQQLHRRLRLKKRVTARSGFVDVFEVICELDIPLVFRPLTSAVGVFMSPPLSGIIVTTLQPNNIQRIIGAYMLGRVILGCGGSVEFKIPRVGEYGFEYELDVDSIVATIFASEFLLPNWIYRYHLNCSYSSMNGYLQDPNVVFQLSLRLGVTYEAACWGLFRQRFLLRRDVEHLLEGRPPS